MNDHKGARLRDKVDWRVKTTAGAWLVVGVGMIMLGMEPRLVLLGFIVIIVAAAMWLILDLGTASSQLVWHNPAPRNGPSERPDLRVQILRTRLRRPPAKRRAQRTADTEAPEPVNEIVETLLSVIDDHLLADHGIDRAADPSAAAQILGPDLTRFTTDSSARRSMTRRRSLAGTIKLIEDLTRSSPSTRVATKDPS
jgi:hypothetical protein